MSVVTELAAPDEIRENERGFTARWLHVSELAPEYEDGRPRKANVVLSVSHLKAGINYWHGSTHGPYYSAALRNESEEEIPRGDGSTYTIRGNKIDFRTNAGVTLVQEPGARMARKRLREILAEAIAETQRLYAAGDERVRALWQGVGC